MTTKTIQSVNESLQVFTGPMGWGDASPSNAQTIKVYDLRSDELPLSGLDDEFEIDEFVAEQDDATKTAVAAAGSWVADTLYPGLTTLSVIRLRAGLSQKQLAQQCGLEQPHISRYESGRHEPGLFQAKSIADALGVTLDQLHVVWRATAASAKK